MKVTIYQSNINTYLNEVYIENSLININETIESFNKLIKDRELSFTEYIEILNKIYNIQITDNDLLKISSIILKNNTKYTILNTDIIYNITKRTEINYNFKYYNESYKLYIKVAFTNDNDIDFKHKYNTDEISKLINEKKIILISFIPEEESNSYYDNYIEIEKLYPLNNITTDNFINIKKINKDYIPALYSFLKEQFTIDKLKKDLSIYLDTTNKKLEVVENYIKNIQESYNIKINKFNNITKECIKTRKRKISD